MQKCGRCGGVLLQDVLEEVGVPLQALHCMVSWRVGRSANPPSSKTYTVAGPSRALQPSLMWPQLEDTWDGAERLDPSIDLEISSLFQLLSPISVSYTTRFLSTPPEFSSLSASELYCRHQGRSERSHMSLERFCDGCGRQRQRLPSGITEIELTQPLTSGYAVLTISSPSPTNHVVMAHISVLE